MEEKRRRLDLLQYKYPETFTLISQAEASIDGSDLGRKEKAFEKALLLYNPCVEEVINILRQHFYLEDRRNPFTNLNLPTSTSIFFFSDIHNPTSLDRRPLWGKKGIAVINGHNHRRWELEMDFAQVPFVGGAMRAILSNRAKKQADGMETVYKLFNKIRGDDTYLMIDGGDRGSDGVPLFDALGSIYIMYHNEQGRGKNIPSIHLAGNHEGCFKYDVWPWFLNDKIFGPSFGYQKIGNKVLVFFDTNLLSDIWYHNALSVVDEIEIYAQEIGKKSQSSDDEIFKKAELLSNFAQNYRSLLTERYEEQKRIIEEVQTLGKNGAEIIIFGHNPQELGKLNQRLYNTTDAFFGHFHYPIDNTTPPLLSKLFKKTFGKNADGNEVELYMPGAIFDLHGLNFFPNNHLSVIIFNPQTREEKIVDLEEWARENFL
jgi:hypothetical protein